MAIGSGAVGCALAGYIADRVGRARVAMWAMIASASCAALTLVVHGRSPWLLYALIVLIEAAIVTIVYRVSDARSAAPQLHVALDR